MADIEDRIKNTKEYYDARNKMFKERYHELKEFGLNGRMRDIISKYGDEKYSETVSKLRTDPSFLAEYKK